MFRKLQIKMVLLNLGVVTMIIITIMALTSYSSMSIMRRKAEDVKNKIEETGMYYTKGPGNYYNAPILGNKMIPVPVDSAGRLILNEQFPGSGTGENNYRQDLFELIDDDMPDMKYIRHEERTFFTFNISSSDITYYFFIDATQERELNKQIMKNTVFIGLIALVMIIISSIFLTQRALIPVARAWNKQRRFISDASHELRTPVAIIKTNMEVVGENDKATIGEQRKWVDNVIAETERMANLIENLLFLSKKDLTKKEKLVSETEMNSEVEKAADKLEAIAAKKGLAIKTDCQNVKVHVPAIEINRLAVILIENAIKYTDTGTIEVKTYTEDGNSILQVKDSGKGMGKNDLSKIFERFFRIDSARSRKIGGYGLGLSIAKSICDSYNGEISVQSEPGEGSVFKVVFPAIK